MPRNVQNSSISISTHGYSLLKHSSYLLDGLYNLYKSGNDPSCNIAIVLNGLEITKVHSIVLAANSTHFAGSLKSINQIFRVKLSLYSNSCDGANIMEVVRYMYTGVISVTEGVLKAAHLMKCTDLVEFLTNLMNDKMQSTSDIEGIKNISCNSSYIEQFLLRIQQFYKDELFIDLKIKLQENMYINLHRSVISAFSNHFSSLFSNIGTKPSVILNFGNDSVDVYELQEIIYFIYYGTFSCLTKEDIHSLRLVASKFQIEKLCLLLDVIVTKIENEEVKTRKVAQENLKKTQKKVEKILYINKYRNIYNTMKKDGNVSGIEYREKPIKCKQCEYQCSSMASMSKHQSCIHSSFTPYKCEICDLKFKIKSNFVRHQRVHTRDKPFKCKLCEVSYADKKNLNNHINRDHLRRKRIHCEHNGCSSKFWQRDKYIVHFVKMHANM